MRISLQMSWPGSICAVAIAADAQMRFQGLETNRDGVITRAEWRGNDTSFRNQDWNQDGILSGEEVRSGGRRQTTGTRTGTGTARVDTSTRKSHSGSAGRHEHDNRVARREWDGRCRAFSRVSTRAATDTSRWRNTPRVADSRSMRKSAHVPDFLQHGQ